MLALHRSTYPGRYMDEKHEDFVLANIKARERMIAQYAVASASARVGVVIGTDHAAELLMGFFTKYGDGGADILPLYGLNKRCMRALAHAMGASREVCMKVPTADLETLTPLKPDEDSYGITYEDIDDFLEGKPVSSAVYTTIYRFYDATHHKRVLPTHSTTTGVHTYAVSEPLAGRGVCSAICGIDLSLSDARECPAQ